MNYFYDRNWIMPYDSGVVCPQAGSACESAILTGDIPFLTGQLGLDFNVTTGGAQQAQTVYEWTVPVGKSWSWSSLDLKSLRFSYNGGVRVQGALAVTGVTLTSQEPMADSRWSGVRLEAGSTGTFTNAQINWAWANRTQAPALAAISAYNATVSLTGTTVSFARNGPAVFMAGTGATLSVIDGTVLRSSEGPGIRADAGAQVTVSGANTQIRSNTAGILASGSGSLARVTGGSVFANNGPAFQTTIGGRIDILRYVGDTPPASMPGPVQAYSNLGGLYAVGAGQQPGGGVFTGERVYECDPSGCANPSVGQHSFDFNNQGASNDAQAESASFVIAPENWWGSPLRSAVETYADAQSYVGIDPILTTPPSLGGGGEPGRPGNTDAPGPPESSVVTAGVWAPVVQAETFAKTGDTDRAGQRLLDAYALASTDDDRLIVSEAAGRLLVVAQPATLTAWAARAASLPSRDRPWARRALALALSAQGRHIEAAAVARSLISEDSEGTDPVARSHRARGLGLLVSFAVARSDEQAAHEALAELAAVDPEGAAELALSVAVAFPDAPVSIGRDAPEAGRAAAIWVAPSETLFTVGPNPSSGTVSITLTLADVADADLAVFDALGREVVVLYGGAVAAGRIQVAFDGSAVPAGVYVIRAVVRSVDGGTQVLTRTLTVAG